MLSVRAAAGIATSHQRHVLTQAYVFGEDHQRLHVRRPTFPPRVLLGGLKVREAHGVAKRVAHQGCNEVARPDENIRRVHPKN